MPPTQLSNAQEQGRLAALREFHIVDTPPEAGFNDIVELASTICGTQCAQISFVEDDVQYIKASVGMPPTSLPRSLSFCAHTIGTGEPLNVPDLTQDRRFRDHPFVQGAPHVRCYIGAPILSREGYVLGAVCVLDTVPRVLSERQVTALQALSRQVVALLEQRRSLLQIQQQAKQQLQANELSLQQTAERLRLCQAAGKIASWDWNLDTGDFIWDGGTEFVYGRPEAEIDTLDRILPLLHKDDQDRVMAAIQSLLQGSATEFRSEFRTRWPDGSVHWLLGIGQLIAATPVSPRRIVGVNTDITARKLAEENLIRSEKVAVVGRLITSIAHEVNNPLGSVTNLLFLAGESETMQEARELLAVAEQELRRVSEIVNQTLRFHRQPAAAAPVWLSSLLEETMKLLQSRIKKSGIVVSTRYRNSRPVMCLEGEVRQVLANLIGNAIDALSASGQLRLRTRDACHWPTGRRGLVVTVADSGTGMSQETLSRIFDAFYTTKGVGGTGLGLWITREIVQRHGSVLRVRSSQRPGMQGTVFTVFLAHAEQASWSEPARACTGAPPPLAIPSLSA